jgi:hypothetical protein
MARENLNAINNGLHPLAIISRPFRAIIKICFGVAAGLTKKGSLNFTDAIQRFVI